MATIREALTLALEYHRTGDLRQAEAIYRQVLQADPRQADAHHLLGVIAYQSGNNDLAIQYISQAIELQPAHDSAYCNLAMALASQGRLAEATEQYRRALRLKPASAEANNNLGNVLMQQGRASEAMEAYRQAVRCKPDFAEAYTNLGHALKAQGKWADAANQFRLALNIKPDLTEALTGLGLTLANMDQLQEAEKLLLRAVQLAPNHAEAHNNLGLTLMKLRHYDRAVTSLRQAQRCDPGRVEIYNNLGLALGELDRFDEAVACLRQALTLLPSSLASGTRAGSAPGNLEPTEAAQLSYLSARNLARDYLQTNSISLLEVHNNIGMILATQGRFDDALASLEEALDLCPDFAEAHFSRALIHLQRGNFEEGWPECEQWRWKCKRFVPRPFQQPKWDGSSLAGRTILLHAEQGLGDTMQFVRYAALIKESGGRVIVECQDELLALLATCPGVDQVYSSESALPFFDFHAPMGDLPAIFRTTLATIPATVPYLFADPALVEQWGKELGHIRDFKIGIAWQGNPIHMNDRRRSAALSLFTPLARLEGIRLFSLQKRFGAEQLDRWGDELSVTDLGSRFGTLMDTASAMRNLDLIITIDSALAHCAGALGVPVWVLLPFVPDYRWLLQRTDSPWYPSMQMFRQRSAGDWEEVFERVTSTIRTPIPSRE